MVGLISFFELTFVFCLQQGKDRELTPQPTFDSDRSVSSYNIQVTEEVMQLSAEALSRTGIPQRSDTQETVRKMAAMKIESVLSTFFLRSSFCSDDSVLVCVYPCNLMCVSV